ncbi:hypothetical protein GCK72_022797 [Caenorhabditis remanei]|uniref:Uncharacterized protein n=1 Tax=Caenorhabditis remanei TaxID=31234 RepID=A0A6A5FUX3_CAERE|nr:hypothetical protein GCK72_022797 [Caenorhabditis remanei]KAF1746344.1 hypothetical protein GCK72_022797 [Caenorhabditis remanei]
MLPLTDQRVAYHTTLLKAIQRILQQVLLPTPAQTVDPAANLEISPVTTLETVISTFQTDDRILVEIPDADLFNYVKLVLNHLEKRVSSISHLAPREAEETIMGIQSLRNQFEVLEQTVMCPSDSDTKLNIQSCEQFSRLSGDVETDYSHGNVKHSAVENKVSQLSGKDSC